MRRNLANKLAKPARFGRISAMSIPAKIALVFMALIILMAVFAKFIAPYDPLKGGVPLQSPSLDHLFGTDQTGRDIFSRVVYGSQYSLLIGLSATAFALFWAAIIGSIAAVSRRWVSEIIMRILDIVMSFPGIALAAVFVSVWGKSLPVLIMTIGFLYIPQLTRIVRANVIDQYGEDYVAAAIVSGARAPWILFKHVARNCIAPIMVFATVLVADAIVFEASLSFISAGVQPPAPSWGNILSQGRALVAFGIPWPTLFPGLAITFTVLALNILSEGLTDAMVAAPSSKVTVKKSDTTDKLLVDPVLAHKAQEESLNQRLTALREVEEQRTDRLVYERNETPILEVKNLSIKFPRHGDTEVVDNVSFSVRPGETMGLVGESGCGKSITSLTIMGLLDPAAEISGEILFDGKDLLKLSARQHAALRGHEMAMIYQDALSSLNPSMLIRSQMNQLIKRGGTRSAEELLELVGLDPERTLKSYPHELSGGQRQRVLIAMALTRDPKLVIADEPTTALDVTVQQQVIDLLNELREKLGFAMIFVSHDLALVAEVAHSITVMYAGQVVEQAPTRTLLMNPRHEYTRGLLGSVLSIESGSGRLHQVPGTVPSPKDFPKGDRFAPRSSHPNEGLDVKPEFTQVPGEPDHYYARPAWEGVNVGVTE
ncbi:ABC transporter [Boudabousia liubingyangii]|uniref:dipeptide/oligopeptide/nickel ABC transporter permease/ATP-binding protein n=1 Tax=Boudabousia liubingyangii TaxID=1921764 RepID=UPI00093D5ADC|nr:dipeptide/oligopeptide/nickel ABC transporter permease/ATP-binding protein [Boudabousia liubingyangii]OKL46509.1 ABC transporter [Boudabousia liubingyangii]